MKKQPTFKEYVESKAQLLQAVSNVPKSIMEYEVRKYCSLTVGESEEDKTLISLKPKHKLIVEWSYANPLTPVLESIKIEGCPDVDADEVMSTFWTSSKLQKWLIRHTNRNSFRT